MAETKQWADPHGRLAQDEAGPVRGLSYEEMLERFPKLRDLEADESLTPEEVQQRVVNGYAELQKLISDSASTQDFVDAQIAKIPEDLADNGMVKAFAKDRALRERVAREPERCPALVAFAGVVSMNRCAVTMGVMSDWPRMGWLAPKYNDHADGRILAMAAYADVLLTKDDGLRRRALRLGELKLFRPDVMRWHELLARPV